MKYFVLFLLISLTSYACPEKVPKDFELIKSEDGSKVFRRGNLVLAMKCQGATPEEMRTALAGLKDKITITKLGGNAYFHELNLESVLSRSYIIPQNNHLLYLSFLGVKKELGDLEMTEKIALDIVNDQHP